MARRAQNTARTAFSNFRTVTTNLGRRIVVGTTTLPNGRRMTMEVPMGRQGGSGSSGG